MLRRLYLAVRCLCADLERAAAAAAAAASAAATSAASATVSLAAAAPPPGALASRSSWAALFAGPRAAPV